MKKKIQTALISVYSKDGLESLVNNMSELGIKIFSTGGTYDFIKKLGVEVNTVEGLTGYPSILDGRVKTLHPKIFGGILAKREPAHLEQLHQYEIPELDLVVVDLYPFEDTVRNSGSHDEIIEKIDIGGISLIRAAAKNYADVVVVPSMAEYADLKEILANGGSSDIDTRKKLAAKAFAVSSKYDGLIGKYLAETAEDKTPDIPLRYGENPHQQAKYEGNLGDVFDILGGKELSYNNLVDIDAALQLIREFDPNDGVAFAVIKHTNACGVAVRKSALEAWQAALAGDPVSAFGGIIVTNGKIDLETAKEIDKIFYEVFICPDFDDAVKELLLKKKNRILLQSKPYSLPQTTSKTLFNGRIVQSADNKSETRADLKTVTQAHPTDAQVQDLLFALKCVKHLKSNTIVLAKNNQLLGMGCGQTSRIDALKQAIHKAGEFGFDLNGSVMASDAFFPFSDCVEIGYEAGIRAVVQPGGSIRDHDSIEKCDEYGIPMVVTGIRHFRH